MLKKLFIFILVSFTFYFLPFTARAEAEFSVDSTVTYEVQETGKTLVTHDVTLENNFSTLYATSYSLSLENIDTANVQGRSVNGEQLSVSSEKKRDITNIKISFPDAVVGRGKQRHFFVTYENSNFAVRTGEVWEISIPKLSDDSSFRNYTAVLKIPDSFGLEAYIYPKPTKKINDLGFKIYEFNKSELTKTGVTAGFGDFQVFTYTLNYHLENPLNRTSATEIAIPPDTAFQRVYIRTIEPKPLEVKIDPDGNWLAIYELKARQRFDVSVSGEVQIFSSERPFPKPTEQALGTSLLGTNYWQTDDPEIKALANKLKTPRAIYDYVSTTLKYDYTRVRPNVERLGAKGALLSPNSAICMEFTDLFIAIARAAGIPAREVNGYAYTENPEIQPLSLVADVLHSWPEYWDEARGAWIPIDPTWASTTGGVNFFDKLDLRHFSFVIHGADSQKPYAPGSYKLGSNPQKDVFVSFGKLSKDTLNDPEVMASVKQGPPFFNSSLNLKITNSGQTAFYSLSPYVYFDSKEFYKDYIEVLPPFSSFETKIAVPYSFLGKNTPDEIRVEVDGSSVAVATNKNNVIISSLIITFIIFIVLITFILWKNHRINFLKVQEFIYSKLVKHQSTSERQ